MSSEYEKQLEEANQKLREQLEKETARADMLEKKLKANEWRGLKEPSLDSSVRKQLDDWAKIIEKSADKKVKF